MQETTDHGSDNKPAAPKSTPSRAQRRASMKHQNKQLWQDREKLVQEINRLRRSVHAMGLFLSDIARTVGVPVPKTPVEGIDTVELVRGRIIALVELEKQLKAGLKIENDLKSGELIGEEQTHEHTERAADPAGGPAPQEAAQKEAGA